jgi:transposase
MGRPSKLTDELSERLVRAIRAGNFPDVAARHAGIHPATYHRWMERGAPGRDAAADAPFRRFRSEVERALADAEAAQVGLILQAARAGRWQAAAWLLERRFPARWGRGEIRGDPDEELDERAIERELERLLEQMAERDGR